MACVLSLLSAAEFGPVGLSPVVLAQEAAEKPADDKPDLPLVVINFASVERLLSDADYMFETAERPELSDWLGGLLANVQDLKGVDRNKPFGVLIYFNLAVSPRPTPVGFVPVEDINELLATVATGPVTTREVPGEENRYEIVGRRGNVQVLVEKGYAFVAPNADSLNRKFIDPANYNRLLTERHDIAVSADLKTVPDAVKGIFLNFLRASSETELQRRNDESEGAHSLRKANGESMMEFTDQLLTQGEKLTIGLTVSAEDKTAAVDVAVDAKEDSEFATYLLDIAGRQSHFANMLDDNVPLAFSMSWMLKKSGKKVLGELLNVTEQRLLTELTGEDAATEDGSLPNSPLVDVFKTLKDTSEAGHVDFVAQFFGDPAEKFVLVGGLRVIPGPGTGAAVVQLLEQLKANPNGGALELDLNVAAHAGVTLHRIRGAVVRPEDELLYGEKPALYVGVGPKAVWFAVGGDDALPALKKAMTAVAEPRGISRQRDPGAPFQFIAHMSRWVELNSEDESPLKQFARDAFTAENDTMRIDFRPTETGARLRVELAEGFVRMLGLSIARRIDESF